jgi:hypothetical protein
MHVGLGIAGVLCIALAAGHATLGLRWVLPGLREDQLPKTPFGGTPMTLSMVRVTWHVVTVFALGLGGLLITLAAGDDVDPTTVALRWVAAMWVAATAVAGYVVRGRLRRPRDLFRLPVPLVWLVVAALCWWGAP